MKEGESKENVLKRSRFQELKGEFKKIVWPNKITLAKQTVVVIVIALVVGLAIAVLDIGIQYLISYLV